MHCVCQIIDELKDTEIFYPFCVINLRTTSETTKTSSKSGTSRFCNDFSIIPSHYACKMYFK